MSLRSLRRRPALARLEVAAAAFALRATLRLLAATVRWKVVGNAELHEAWRDGVPVLVAFWHGRALMLPAAYRGRGACIMNSTHRDGEIVSRALAGFGIESTRGSSTRGAVPGFRALLRAHGRGLDLALIPDGPRGPAGVAKAGAAELALATGARLFPVATSCARGWRLGTWDRLLVPRPFSRVVLAVGDPLDAGKPTGRDRSAAREELRRRLEDALHAVTREADLAAGRHPAEDA